MFIIQYDFRLEFFDTVKEETELELGLPADKPKYIIETKNGCPEVNIDITNIFSSFSTLLTKQAKLKIYNVPFIFNDDINVGDIIKISYKKYAYERDYTFILSGYIGTPEDSDYESGDFSVDYNIFLMTKKSFYNRELKNKQFGGKTVEKAILEVFSNRAVLNMTEAEKLKVIKKGFYARTPAEFVEKLKPDYVHFVNVDSGDAKDGISTVYYFNNFSIKDILSVDTKGFKYKSELTTKGLKIQYTALKGMLSPDIKSKDYNPFLSGKGVYKPLEHYGLIFIPQQDITNKISQPVLILM